MIQKFGVCHFDDNTRPTEGWASVDGEEAQRVSRIGDLSTDVVWIVNLTYRVYKDMNLISLPHVFDEQYFRTSYTQIGKENGFVGQPNEQAKFVSKVFSQISAYAEKYFDVDMKNTSYRFASTLNDYVLPSFARSTPDHSNYIEIMDAIRQSTQVLQVMTDKAPKGSVAHNFIFPRGAYAKWLLRLEYPKAGTWKVIPEKSNKAIFGYENGQMIKGTTSILKKYISLGEHNAAFLRVKVLSQEKEFSTYQAFGACGGFTKDKFQLRQWCSLPEILHLSTFSKLEVSGGYCVPTGKLDCLDNLDLPENEFSYSRSVFLENLYVAISSPPYGDERKPSSIGAYLRAYDRIACAKAAEVFSKAGFVVGSFGIGRVTVFLREGEVQMASDIALKVGLLPPINQSKEVAK